MDDSKEEQPERYGFIADEVQRILPEMVRQVNYAGKGEIKAVAYQDILALSIAAQQAQDDRLDRFKTNQDQVKERLEKLEKGSSAEGHSEIPSDENGERLRLIERVERLEREAKQTQSELARMRQTVKEQQQFTERFSRMEQIVSTLAPAAWKYGPGTTQAV